MDWFRHNFNLSLTTTDYRQLIAHPEVEAVYCAVPHNLHEQVYVDILRAGKHLFGEKPFGIDQSANRVILEEIGRHPDLFVRCVSQFAFYPGAYRIFQWMSEGRFGRIISAEAGFLHSSDLDPRKPINWKRQIAFNGEYGCMGDLGFHILYLPLRFGWMPRSLRALLSKIVTQRPDKEGNLVPCETWDNAVLACDVNNGGCAFPMLLATKRIAPGNQNTWYIKIEGTEFSAQYSLQNPKQIAYLPYVSGSPQAWHVQDLAHQSAYASITGHIFEFGASDAMLQMIAAFCDELLHGSAMQQPLYCATPDETARSHAIFSAALTSQRQDSVVQLDE